MVFTWFTHKLICVFVFFNVYLFFTVMLSICKGKQLKLKRDSTFHLLPTKSILIFKLSTTQLLIYKLNYWVTWSLKKNCFMNEPNTFPIFLWNLIKAIWNGWNVICISWWSLQRAVIFSYGCLHSFHKTHKLGLWLEMQRVQLVLHLIFSFFLYYDVEPEPQSTGNFFLWALLLFLFQLLTPEELKTFKI